MENPGLSKDLSSLGGDNNENKLFSNNEDLDYYYDNFYN